MFEKEVSNTYLYEPGGEKIGSFATPVDSNDNKSLKLYLSDSYTGSHSSIEGYVLANDGLGEFSSKKNIKLSVDDNNMTNVTYNGKTGSDAGFTDENGVEFTFSSFVQAPFTFRDYHVVNVGLTKI